MFEKVMLLDTTSDFWYHTVIVPKPTVQNVRAENINACEDSLKVNLNKTIWDKLMIENCADFQFILDIYGNVRKEFTYMIADQTQLIELLLKNKDYRNRRSNFGVTGYYEDQRGRRDCGCEEIIDIVNQNMDQLTESFQRVSSSMDRKKVKFLSMQRTQTTRIRRVFRAIHEISIAKEEIQSVSSVFMNETSREMGIMNDELHDLIIQTNQRQEILAYLHWVNVKDVYLSHMIVSELEFFYQSFNTTSPRVFTILFCICIGIIWHFEFYSRYFIR